MRSVGFCQKQCVGYGASSLLAPQLLEVRKCGHGTASNWADHPRPRVRPILRIISGLGGLVGDS